MVGDRTSPNFGKEGMLPDESQLLPVCKIGTVFSKDDSLHFKDALLSIQC